MQALPLQLKSLLAQLPARAHDAHKGDFGTALILAGGPGMPGAARLCSEACARVGAGITLLATHPSHAAILAIARPEIISHGVDSASAFKRLLKKASVLALGPGLANEPWSLALLAATLPSSLPMVIDAGALDYIKPKRGHHSQWIMTPHPKEAARLLDTTVQAVQQDRNAAIQALQARYGGVVVLKGAGTLIYDGHTLNICQAGNPGMASGGMGDLLTGIIAGLVAQKLNLKTAACLGVMLHATAGDLAAKAQGERGLLALDLLPYLIQLLNQRCGLNE